MHSGCRSQERTIRLGTRGSRLALAQAESVRALLEPFAGTVEIVTIRTSGDKGERDRLGAFVKEIQEAILDRRIDVGLHCLKDLPTTPVEGLCFGAYLPRENPSDAILSKPTWRELPHGATVGTGSVRRSAQLAALRPDLRFKPLLGNVDTRLRKLMDGEYDAIILALAGLRRLGILDSWTASEFGSIQVQPFQVAEMLPAPGQAVLVIECLEGELAQALAPLNDGATQAAATSERAFLRAFGGGCSVPVAALAEMNGTSLSLSGLVARPDGTKILRGSASGDEPEEVGRRLAEQLIDEGALEMFSRTAASVGGAEH